jgi:hypothetical protein
LFFRFIEPGQQFLRIAVIILYRVRVLKIGVVAAGFRFVGGDAPRDFGAYSPIPLIPA